MCFRSVLVSTFCFEVHVVAEGRYNMYKYIRKVYLFSVQYFYGNVMCFALFIDLKCRLVGVRWFLILHNFEFFFDRAYKGSYIQCSKFDYIY